DWAEAIRLAPQFNILSRIDNALQFAKRSRVLLMRHTTSGIDVDLTFGELPFERAAVANCENHDVGGIRVRLPRVEDLLVMKAIARRPKDIEDLKGLLAAHPNADVARARRWVREFERIAAAHEPSAGARGTPTGATVADAGVEVGAARVRTARGLHFAGARRAVT